MAIDPNYIPAFSIEDVLLDKDTGAPLSGGLVYFYHDNQRGVFKDVFQITGTSSNYTYTALPNPMVLSSIGTFEDSLSNPVVPYFFPYDANLNPDYYYVVVTSSEGVEQFVRQAVPYIADTGSSSTSSAFVNEISNPQFAEVLFDTNIIPYVYNFNAVSNEVVEIAPGWEIVVTCSGVAAVSVTQLTPIGTLNDVTNPGTILNISSSGLTAPFILRQRLYGSPNLWGFSNLSASFMAKTYSDSPVQLILSYSQSNGTVVNMPIVTATLTGDYEDFPGTIFIPESTSIQSFPDAYVDIFFTIPIGVQIDISSVMVASTGSVSVPQIVYQQTTLDRQIDQLFHYYQPQINFKPIPSLLIGWDFPVNPAQIGSTTLSSTVTITTTAGYPWDQTICQSVVGNIAVIRNAVTGGFQATTANAAEAFYQLQYLSGTQVKKMLGTPLSVNINAFRTQVGGAVAVQVYLYAAPSTATIPVLSSAGAIVTIDYLGVSSLTMLAEMAGWQVIPRGNLGQAAGTLGIVDTTDYTTLNGDLDLGFSGWELDDSTVISDTNFFAIVVTYSCPISGTVITAQSISLVPGLIPTRPAPKTLPDTLLECQHYFQRSFSYNVGISTNAGTGIGESYGNQVPVALHDGSYGPIIRFPTPMRVSPSASVTLYNPSATNNQIRDAGTGTDWTNSVAGVISTLGFIAVGTTPSGSLSGNGCLVHWVADARLGVV